MQLYDTLSEQKQPLPINPGHPLHIFVCGPTVYDDPHIGNARTFVFFDIFVRYLRSQGMDVFYVQNITDVDDKIMARAKERGTTWKKVSREYERVFLSNVRDLHIDSVNNFAKATSYIPEIVKQVKTLVEKGSVYLIPNDGYYFDLSTFPDYGKLAHRTMEQAEDGVSRIDDSSRKKNKGDFCVWKFSKSGEPRWKTELGYGRPGWHIEDTAITGHFFGPQYDIHGGAMDLKFPHHEAELALQESASGLKPFVKIWMHSGFLTVEGKRMGKSNHNFITINDLLREHSPNAFRMAVFMHHYRQPYDHSKVVMETAAKNVRDILLFTEKLLFAAKKNSKKATDVAALRECDLTVKNFGLALDDDFNSPRALATVFEYMTAVQKRVWEIPKKDATYIATTIRALFADVGIELKSPKIPKEIKTNVKAREEFKRSQQFVQSDALRKEMSGVGYVVEDTPRGPFVMPAA